MCDNIAMVEVLTFGRARDPIMAISARNIWLLVAMFNVNIVVNHISGLENTVADFLSRWHQNLHHLIDSPVWLNANLDVTLLNLDI